LKVTTERLTGLDNLNLLIVVWFKAQDDFQEYISPTFYKQFLLQYTFAKKLQSKIIIREKLQKNTFI